jgi:hypothetical protein
MRTSSGVGPSSSSDFEAVRSFVASFKVWVEHDVPVIERGITSARANPVELVWSFYPWLRQALETLGPNPAALSPEENNDLIVVFDKAIDAVERVYAGSGQSPAIAMSLLGGLEDLLIALALRARAMPHAEDNPQQPMFSQSRQQRRKV